MSLVRAMRVHAYSRSLIHATDTAPLPACSEITGEVSWMNFGCSLVFCSMIEAIVSASSGALTCEMLNSVIPSCSQSLTNRLMRLMRCRSV